MATLDIKFTKFDNRPWGFRLAGGSDFPEPLTVIRVSEESLAECMGLKVGDVVVKLNDQPISELTHGQAHEALVLAGNNFVLGVRRTEDPNKTVEGIEEKIEPYMLPLEEILFAPIEEKRETTPDEVPQIEDESAPLPEPEPSEPVELYPEKPRDENSDPLPNTNLTDEEIAQLILDEEEVLNEKGVLGVNFKKLRPRAPLLKESKVFQELQQEANSEPVQLQELKRQTTFLQKPERPVPKPRRVSQSEESAEPEVEPYRVVIKKQPKKSVTERLLERGLLEPSRGTKTPETCDLQTSEVNDEPEIAIFLSELYTEIVDVVEPPVTQSEIVGRACTAWSYTSSIDNDDDDDDELEMLPINEEQPACTPAPPTITQTAYDELVPASFVPVIKLPPRKRQRLCRRGRYLNRALESLGSSSSKRDKPRLVRRPRYFERIVGDLKRSVTGARKAEDDSLLRLLMFASLACSIRETYDTEILHRGSSRRNSRRASSCRRESSASSGAMSSFESGILAFKAQKEAERLNSFQSRCAEGRRRLSVMSMMVADKVSSAMRTDLARGLAYAMLPCASALAFFMFNFAKRYNYNNASNE